MFKDLQNVTIYNIILMHPCPDKNSFVWLIDTRSLGRVNILHTIFYFKYVSCGQCPQQTAMASGILVCFFKIILALGRNEIWRPLATKVHL